MILNEDPLNIKLGAKFGIVKLKIIGLLFGDEQQHLELRNALTRIVDNLGGRFKIITHLFVKLGVFVLGNFRF